MTRYNLLRTRATTRAVLLFTASILLAVTTSSAWAASLSKIRVGQSADKTRVVFEIKKNHRFEISHLSNPARIVVDFYKASNEIAFKSKKLLDERVKNIRVSDNKQRTRVVLDLRHNFDYRYFVLGKNKAGAERVVIDVKKQLATAAPVVKATPKTLAKALPKLAPKSAPKTMPKILPKVAAKPVPKSLPKQSVLTKRTVKPKSLMDSAPSNALLQPGVPLVEKEEFVVAIDAGHGGKDTGAIGLHHHTYEKVVTLQLAKKLKQYIDKIPGMRAVLTRNNDVFIPLHKRVQIAHAKDADIFISLHADSFPSAKVRGGSVYVLSTKGASSVMAKMLARSENASLHDIKLKGSDQDVAFVLSDLSREANIRASRKLAKTVLSEMGTKVHLHKKSVQSADFAVLKSIDMPSLLVETAFLSNPDEEKNLLNREFQIRMAKAIAFGLEKFVERNAKEPRWGESLYVYYRVKAGDTLSEIADNYEITTRQLKKLNKIKNANQLFVGRKLRIPLSEKLVAGL